MVVWLMLKKKKGAIDLLLSKQTNKRNDVYNIYKKKSGGAVIQEQMVNFTVPDTINGRQHNFGCYKTNGSVQFQKKKNYVQFVIQLLFI